MPKLERETEKLSSEGQDLDSPQLLAGPLPSGAARAAEGGVGGRRTSRQVDIGLTQLPCDKKSLVLSTFSVPGPLLWALLPCCSVRHKTSTAHFAAGANEAQRGQVACLWSPQLWSLSSSGVPRGLASCESTASPPGRTAQETKDCQSVYFFFPFVSGFGFVLNSGLQKMKPKL